MPAGPRGGRPNVRLPRNLVWTPRALVSGLSRSRSNPPVGGIQVVVRCPRQIVRQGIGHSAFLLAYAYLRANRLLC